MTLEDALGYKPETLEDFVRARILFCAAKSGVNADVEERVEHMTNYEFLAVLSLALDDMQEDKE